MNEFVVELRNVSKHFPPGRSGQVVTAVHQLNLSIRPGEFFTLLGPSGCGKTTTLRMIAGFETPSSGEIMIAGQPMSKVPPNRRPVNTVFQNYALFPHLSVAQNVGFGLSVRRVSRDERERRVREALALVQLPGMEDRKPWQLSGGQQQRVALARALINRPAVLLLDEPLGALDLKLRKAMQLELKHLQSQVETTFIYVTHDQEEALTMSDRIGVMDQGVLLQVDEPVTIYEKPATRFVADFIGETNFLAGVIAGASGDRVQLTVAGQEIVAQAGEQNSLVPGRSVTLAVRPEKLALAPTDNTSQPGIAGIVEETIYIGTDTRYVVALPSGEKLVVRAQNIGGRGLGAYGVGEQVRVCWALPDARILHA